MIIFVSLLNYTYVPVKTNYDIQYTLNKNELIFIKLKTWFLGYKNERTYKLYILYYYTFFQTKNTLMRTLPNTNVNGWYTRISGH